MQRTTLFAGTLPLAYTDSGRRSSSDRTFLLLHGGAGPASMQSLTTALSAAPNHRALVPVHPGFDGEPRPAYLTTVSELATAYLALLDQLDVHDVIVAGSSMGGWLAAELASRSPNRISGYVVINGVGIDTDGTGLHIRDAGSMAAAERDAAIWHDPGKYAALGGAQSDVALQNGRTLAVYCAREPFAADPTLRARLSEARVSVPVLVLWGESDKIVNVEYGRHFASAMGEQATFETVSDAGHFPLLEQPDATTALIKQWAAKARTPSATAQSK